jgi:hypothetical protein
LQAFINTVYLLHKYLGHGQPIPPDLHSLAQNLDPSVTRAGLKPDRIFPTRLLFPSVCRRRCTPRGDVRRVHVIRPA